MTGTYHRVKVGLSRPQMLKLAKGQQVRIPHHKLGTGVTVHVTKTQYGKMGKAMRAKKGCMLKFSDAQRRHNLKGTGFVDFFKKAFGAVKKVISHPAVKTLVHAGAKKLMDSGLIEKGASMAINKAAEFAAKKGVPEALIQGAKGKATALVDNAMKKAEEHLEGAGLSRASARRVLKSAARAHKRKHGMRAHVKRLAFSALGRGLRRISRRRRVSRKARVGSGVRRRRTVRRKRTTKRRVGGSFLL